MMPSPNCLVANSNCSASKPNPNSNPETEPEPIAEPQERIRTRTRARTIRLQTRTEVRAPQSPSKAISSFSCNKYTHVRVKENVERFGQKCEVHVIARWKNEPDIQNQRRKLT
ncbi:unnamed protein product [Adineta ricciae]|uniref:Uncharacterized protein n=2 Tax=Adineta ricciae TaxID=249248 RepID=A0A815VEX7_ADIRI|nr:unnamed protein product [Adineta ricciae]